jgi:DNA helicase-2/ATP-dependent DNA helicase PcrA
VDDPLALNSRQREAVEHPGGPLLIVAGAGSGKTRVLTARVAHLMSRGAPPESILAFTFTNRAAREMRERIERTAGSEASRVWMGTFHATAVRILRREARHAGLAPSFVIYDREDQERVLGQVLAELGVADTLPPGQVLSHISDAKNALVGPDQAERAAVTPHQRLLAECRRRYDGRLRSAMALDFDDLIAETVLLFARRPEVRERYARRFEHVLVDEYQDTNHAQFRLIDSLTAVHRNPFVVGDDDQSIYGWRGADLRNVLEFEKHFPGAAVIRLEQNYRSTTTILDAANAVIANNRDRKGKNLWSDRGRGVPLRFVLARDETEEAMRIRSFLLGRAARGERLDRCAVLYRTNAQSRALETELRRERVPYEVVGGVAFYQRREVKDLLAYLRIAVGPRDSVAFWRVWNTPRRGLGDGARQKLEALMRESDVPPVEGLRTLVRTGALPRKAAEGARGLVALIDELVAGREDPVDTLLGRVLERTRYLEHLGEAGGDADDRRANVEELLVAAAGYAGTGEAGLADFLAESALTTDADRMGLDQDRVVLMTAHNAKGLEFPAVVIAGLEEGLFPHGNSLDDAARLEEERRLFYVALTRASDEVLLTAAAYRRRFDGARGGRVSRFVDEIPSELLERDEPEARAEAGAERWSRLSAGDEAGERPAPFRSGGRRHPAIGREVHHEQFGRGVVVDAEGRGADARYTVRFDSRVRRILGRFLTESAHVD